MPKRTPKTKAIPNGMVPNRYNVPTRHWNQWRSNVQALFNTVYTQIVANQSVIAPPSIAECTPRAWQVICWNIAWLAMDEVQTMLNEKS